MRSTVIWDIRPKKQTSFCYSSSTRARERRSLKSTSAAKSSRAELTRRNDLKNRLEFRKTLSAVDQATYFSAWHYAAIHLLLSVPGLDNREALARYLKLSPKRVAQTLAFLVESGLAVEKKGISARAKPASTWAPTHRCSPNTTPTGACRLSNRSNASGPKKLHYSSAVTLARADIPAVKEILVEAIERVRAVVRPSKEEALYCYALDLFEVGE